MRYVITALQPGTIGLRFDQPPTEALLNDLAACPAIWQLYQADATVFQAYIVPRYIDEVAFDFINGWLSGNTGMKIRCASYAVLPPEAGLWIGTTVFPLFLTDQEQLNVVKAVPHAQQVECLDPDKGIFQVYAPAWRVQGVINEIRTRLAALSAGR